MSWCVNEHQFFFLVRQQCDNSHSPLLRLSGHHHHGAYRRFSILGLTEHTQRAVPPAEPRPRLAALWPPNAQVSQLDITQLSTLPAGCPVSGQCLCVITCMLCTGNMTMCISLGVLQLFASGDLLAHDWSAVDGRGPGQSGPMHAVAACPLRFLSVSVHWVDGSTRHVHMSGVMTAGEHTHNKNTVYSDTHPTHLCSMTPPTSENQHYTLKTKANHREGAEPLWCFTVNCFFFCFFFCLLP